MKIKYFNGLNWEEVSRNKFKTIENNEEIKEVYNSPKNSSIAVIFQNNKKVLYRDYGGNNFQKLKDCLIKEIINLKPSLKSKEQELITENEEFLHKLSNEIFEENKIKRQNIEKEKMKKYLGE